MKNRIVITGASGTVGSWLCRVLGRDFDVFGYIRENSNSSRLINVPNLTVRIESSERTWASFLHEDKPYILILADWWGVGNRERNSEDQEVNRFRQEQLTRVALEEGCQIIMGIGSQAELGIDSKEMHEDSLDNPLTEYGRVKVKTRINLQNICQEYSRKFYWARIFSTYGPMDVGNWFIPNLISALSEKKPFHMTSGQQMWNYTHLFDIGTAINTVLVSLPETSVINIANNESVRIIDVANKLSNIMDSSELLRQSALKHRSDTTHWMVPTTRTLTSLGWTPSVDLDSGLQETVAWFKGKNVFNFHRNNLITEQFVLPSVKDLYEGKIT